MLHLYLVRQLQELHIAMLILIDIAHHFRLTQIPEGASRFEAHFAEEHVAHEARRLATHEDTTGGKDDEAETEETRAGDL